MKNQQIKTFMMVKSKDEKGIERVGYIDMIEGTIRDANGHEWKIDMDDVRRCTGVRDRNNHMIFEGDEVVDTSFGDVYKGKVNWSRLFCGWRIGDRAMYDDSFSVNEYERVETQ